MLLLKAIDKFYFTVATETVIEQETICKSATQFVQRATAITN